MEKMSDKEKKKLNDLQAKAKRIERQKKKLMSEAEEIKDELLERWGVHQEEKPESDTWKEIYTAYGINEEDTSGQEKLYVHLVSDRQVSYYHNYGKR